MTLTTHPTSCSSVTCRVGTAIGALDIPAPGSCLGRRATDEAGGACSGVPLPAWRSPVLRNLVGVVIAAVSARVAHDGGPKTPPVCGVAGRNEAVEIQVGVRAAFTASRRRRRPGGDRLVEGTAAVFRVCERHTVPTHFSSAGAGHPRESDPEAVRRSWNRSLHAYMSVN